MTSRIPFGKHFPLGEGFKRICTVITQIMGCIVAIVSWFLIMNELDKPISQWLEAETLVKVIFLMLAIPATFVVSQLTLLFLFTVIISSIKWIKDGFKQDRENGQKQ